MIPQEVKDKLKLKATGIHNGASFINNCETMFSETLDCYVSDCDIDGNALDGRYMVFNKKKGQWRSGILSHEFIINTPEDILLSMIKEATAIEESITMDKGTNKEVRE